LSSTAMLLRLSWKTRATIPNRSPESRRACQQAQSEESVLGPGRLSCS
jgi:hypothetical protein